jgi:hypothetical protein
LIRRGAGADAFVLFNRFYQRDIDLIALRLRRDLELSTPEFCIAERYWVEGLPSRALLAWGQSAFQLQPQQTP